MTHMEANLYRLPAGVPIPRLECPIHLRQRAVTILERHESGRLWIQGVRCEKCAESLPLFTDASQLQ